MRSSKFRSARFHQLVFREAPAEDKSDPKAVLSAIVFGKQRTPLMPKGVRLVSARSCYVDMSTTAPLVLDVGFCQEGFGSACRLYP